MLSIKGRQNGEANLFAWHHVTESGQVLKSVYNKYLKG
jgi:hypothetical protein